MFLSSVLRFMSRRWGEHTDEEEDVSVNGYSSVSPAGQDWGNDGSHQGMPTLKNNRHSTALYGFVSLTVKQYSLLSPRQTIISLEVIFFLLHIGISIFLFWSFCMPVWYKTTILSQVEYRKCKEDDSSSN